MRYEIMNIPPSHTHTLVGIISMPTLHSLCRSPTSSSLPNDISNQIAASTLSSKPPTPLHTLPLPDIPIHMKHKILSLEIMGIDSGQALALNPALHSVAPDSINDVISYLLSKGIHHKDLPRIIGMHPCILTSSISSDLTPVFAFLSRQLNVPNANFRRVINKCPRLLVSSVRDQLTPTLIYLQNLGFKDMNALAYQDPILLVSGVEKTLIPKLEYLMGLGLMREEVVDMVLRCPSMFTFSIERNFTPKFTYLVEEMGGGLEELKEFPQYFTFSLEKRIKPRYCEMMESGTKLRLPEMLKSTDEEFNNLIHKEKKIERK